MKKLLIFGIIALTALSGFSQADNGNYDFYSRTIDLNQKSLAFGLTEAQFNTIKEQAYSNPNFLEGNIYQGDKVVKTDVAMRYNTFADEIEISKNATGEEYSALIKDPNIFVKILKDIYIFVPYQGSNEKGGYFQVLADGKNYDLYKKTSSVFREPRKAKTSYEADTPPAFEKTTMYYLVQNGTFLEMPTRKSKILKMMDKKKGEIKSYISQNNLNIDKENDLVKVVLYFDSLL